MAQPWPRSTASTGPARTRSPAERRYRRRRSEGRRPITLVTPDCKSLDWGNHGVHPALAQALPGTIVMWVERSYGLGGEAGRERANPLATALPLGPAMWLGLLVLILGALRWGG